MKADGSVERKKARLVVDRHRQRHGIDYAETFALVAKMVTIRALLAIAPMHNWETFYDDDMLKEVYMKMPLRVCYVGLYSKSFKHFYF